MINANTIIYIHDYLTNYFKDLEDPIQPPGIKNRGGIESAASRPDLNPEYDSHYLKGAALFHSIIIHFIMVIKGQLYYPQFII